MICCKLQETHVDKKTQNTCQKPIHLQYHHIPELQLTWSVHKHKLFGAPSLDSDVYRAPLQVKHQQGAGGELVFVGFKNNSHAYCQILEDTFVKQW